MDIGGEPCSCGNYGCLERYCSATAVIRMGKQMVLQHPDSLMYDLCGGDVSKLTAKMVFDAAKELDDVAMKVLTTTWTTCARPSTPSSPSWTRR